MLERPLVGHEPYCAAYASQERTLYAFRPLSHAKIYPAPDLLAMPHALSNADEASSQSRMPECRAEVAVGAIRYGRVQARGADQKHEDGQQAAGCHEHAELRRRVRKVPRRCSPERVGALTLGDGLALAVAIMLVQARVGRTQTGQRPAVCTQLQCRDACNADGVTQKPPGIPPGGGGHIKQLDLPTHVEIVASGGCACRGMPASAEMRRDAGLPPFESPSVDCAMLPTAVPRWR